VPLPSLLIDGQSGIEYDKYRKLQDAAMVSDFDKAIQKLPAAVKKKRKKDEQE
jgi:hypothetical protein